MDKVISSDNRLNACIRLAMYVCQLDSLNRNTNGYIVKVAVEIREILLELDFPTKDIDEIISRRSPELVK